MKRMWWMPILVLCWACGDKVPEKSAPTQKLPTQSSTTPAATEVIATDSGPARTDFTTHDPPFPASVVLPEGVVAKTIWKRLEDDNGLFFEFAQVAVTLGDRTMVIETKERAFHSSHPSYIIRERERRKAESSIQIDKEGEDGSFAFSYSTHIKDTTVEVRGVSAQESIVCEVAALEKQWSQRAVDICMSIRSQGGKAAVREGPDVAFPDLAAPENRQMVWKLVMALMRNDQAGSAAFLDDKVNLLGKKQSKARLVKRMAKTSARFAISVPCSALDEPGEPEDENNHEKWAIKLFRDPAFGTCKWHAYLTESGAIEVFSGGGEEHRADHINRMIRQPAFILGKNEDGWLINSVVIRRREIFEPVTKEQRDLYMQNNDENRVDWEGD